MERRAEYAHMADVWHDMSRFKSNVDIMTAGLEINPNARIVLNSPIQVVEVKSRS
jgi:hypothetical protein